MNRPLPFPYAVFFGFAVVNQGKNIKEVLTSLEYTIQEMADKPVADDELAKAKNQTIAGFIIGREGVQSKADFLGRCTVLLSDATRYNTELESYRKVTAADVQRVVKRYLGKTNQTRVFIAPDQSPDKAEAK